MTMRIDKESSKMHNQLTLFGIIVNQTIIGANAASPY